MVKRIFAFPIKAQKFISAEYLVLDTETTGIDLDSEIVDIGIVDNQGEIVLDSLVKPLSPIPKDATAIHGITDKMVEFAPTWKEIWPRIRKALKNSDVAIYNAEFDLKMIKRSCEINDISYSEPFTDSLCIMKLFAEYNGEYDDFHESYKWKKLEFAGNHFSIKLENTHRALDDAKLANQVLLKLINIENQYLKADETLTSLHEIAVNNIKNFFSEDTDFESDKNYLFLKFALLGICASPKDFTNSLDQIKKISKLKVAKSLIVEVAKALISLGKNTYAKKVIRGYSDDIKGRGYLPYDLAEYLISVGEEKLAIEITEKSLGEEKELSVFEIRRLISINQDYFKPQIVYFLENNIDTISNHQLDVKEITLLWAQYSKRDAYNWLIKTIEGKSDHSFWPRLPNDMIWAFELFSEPSIDNKLVIQMSKHDAGLNPETVEYILDFIGEELFSIVGFNKFLYESKSRDKQKDDSKIESPHDLSYYLLGRTLGGPDVYLAYLSGYPDVGKSYEELVEDVKREALHHTESHSRAFALETLIDVDNKEVVPELDNVLMGFIKNIENEPEARLWATAQMQLRDNNLFIEITDNFVLDYTKISEDDKAGYFILRIYSELIRETSDSIKSAISTTIQYLQDGNIFHHNWDKKVFELWATHNKLSKLLLEIPPYIIDEKLNEKELLFIAENVFIENSAELEKILFSDSMALRLAASLEVIKNPS